MLAIGAAATASIQAVAVGPGSAAGIQSVAMGMGSSGTGSNTVAIGVNAGRSGDCCVTGLARILCVRARCVTIGSHAGTETTGEYNVFVGAMAGLHVTSGQYNVIIGGHPGEPRTTYNRNVVISDGEGTVRMRWVDGARNAIQTLDAVEAVLPRAPSLDGARPGRTTTP